MKKSIFCVLLGCCLLMTGCGGSTDSDTTVQGEATTASTSATEQTSAAEESEPETTTVATGESEPTEVTTAQSEPAESDVEIEVTDTYAEMITAFDNTYLGLPRADKIYVFQSTGDYDEIGGEICYAVSCYDEHEGTLYYMCDFYITEDGSAVYRYYLSDDKYVLLPESKGFAQMDPTSQTADEIFAVANELYGYFDLCALNGYDDKTLEAEVDGETWTYYMVSDERLDTKAELLSALSCYFSSDIINSLMDTSMYREGMDGKLYSTGGARGSDIFHQKTVYELVSLTEDTAVFKGYATYSNEIMEDAYTEEFTYNAVKQDGRWVFTNFDLPY